MATRPADCHPDAPMFEADAWGLTSQGGEVSAVAGEHGESQFAARAYG